MQTTWSLRGVVYSIEFLQTASGDDVETVKRAFFFHTFFKHTSLNTSEVKEEGRSWANSLGETPRLHRGSCRKVVSGDGKGAETKSKLGSSCNSVMFSQYLQSTDLRIEDVGVSICGFKLICLSSAYPDSL